MFLLQYPCLRAKTEYKILNAEYAKPKEVNGDGEADKNCNRIQTDWCIDADGDNIVGMGTLPLMEPLGSTDPN